MWAPDWWRVPMAPVHSPPPVWPMPGVAPKFWERMAAGGGGAPPEFMSTHPSDETRVRQLNEHMAEALKYYKP